MKRRRIRRALTIVLAVAVVLIGANVVIGTFLLPETGSYPTGLFVDDAARGLAAAPHFTVISQGW
jgi:hypothetical protein